MKLKYMYCICLNNALLPYVKKLNYMPVGLGNEDFSDEWLKDSTQENISYKNKYYSEYTFHYWFWKNMIDKIEDNEWIGFCAYRRFWMQDLESKNDSIYNLALHKIPDEWSNYDTIIGDKLNLSSVKWTKVLKYGKISFLRNPLAIFKNKRSIRFHFDMFHGNGVLDKAADLLDEKDKKDFKEFIKINNSYNQGNMFICKSKKIIKDYYKTLFEWLLRCEEIFGFDLQGYGQTRIYAFLGERFLPYWFNKYTKPLEWPIRFYDLRSEKK